MVFYPPAWAPSLTDASIPDDMPLEEFLFDDRYRPRKCADSPPPFIDSVDGTGSDVRETQQRIGWLAAGLAKQLDIQDVYGDVWERVVSIFAINNVHTPIIAWATHRINGVVAPVNVAFTASELELQLTDSESRCLFTCSSHLATALEAADKAGVPRSRVFLIPTLEDAGGKHPDFLYVADLIDIGRQLSPLPRIKWSKGQARQQVAYLCYSSGTSGKPKGVMISHRNIIANIMQVTLYESTYRDEAQKDIILGVLPQSHIYSIVLVTHLPTFRGDTVIIMTRFNLKDLLTAVKRFQMTFLYVVPPMLVSLAKESALAKDKTLFDMPTVRRIFCGAAPLSAELTNQIRARYPGVLLGQGYGMTEVSTVVTLHPKEVYDGSSGCILPCVEFRIVDATGADVEKPNQLGELLVKGPNVTLGYYKNEKATRETFVDGWIRTGDEVELRVHPKTKDVHLFVIDRVKELIKVSGFQVAPAELEGHLLGHPLVADCAVISVPHDRSGEVPKAMVVLSKDAAVTGDVAQREIMNWVAKHKSKHKHLNGGVEFISEIPKSPSGKILRRFLRDRERARLTRIGAKL